MRWRSPLRTATSRRGRGHCDVSPKKHGKFGCEEMVFIFGEIWCVLTWRCWHEEFVECFVIGLTYLFGIHVMCCQILKKSQTTASEGVERSRPWLASDCSGWWYGHCLVRNEYHVLLMVIYQCLILQTIPYGKHEPFTGMNPLPACAAWIKQCKAVNSIHWGVSPCIHHPPMTSPVLLRSQWCPGDTKRTRKKCIATPPQKRNRTVNAWRSGNQMTVF